MVHSYSQLVDWFTPSPANTSFGFSKFYQPCMLKAYDSGVIIVFPNMIVIKKKKFSGTISVFRHSTEIH